MSLTYASLLSPLMDSTGLISTIALNSTAQTALAAGTYASAEVDVLKITALQESGGTYTGLPATNLTMDGDITCSTLNYTTLNPPVSGGSETLSQVLTNGNDAGEQNITGLKNLIFKDGQIMIPLTNIHGVGISFDGSNLLDITRVDCQDIIATGDITCSTLYYSTLEPPIAPGSTPNIEQVLLTGNDCNGQSITNATTIQCNEGFFTSTATNSTYVNVLNQSHSAYHNITANTSGLDLNTKWTSDGLILHKVSTGSDITIQNDVNNLITLGTSSGFADLQVGTLKYTALDPAPPTPAKPTYTYFVSKGGSDSGTGTLSDPFLTVQHAVNVCETAYDGTPRVINVLAGSYTETLSISKSRISIIGEGVGTHPDVGTSLYGNINILLMSGNSDLNNNNITLSGFLIVGTIDDSTTDDRPHRLIVNNCHIYGNDRCLYMHPLYDYRVFVSNCVISNDNLTSIYPLVQCSGIGMVSFNQTQMTAKGASQIVFKLSGTCRIDVFAQNILTSDSIGTNVAVAIFNHNSTQTITLGGNAFVYGQSGDKRNAETASGVFVNNTGSLVLLSNTFVMTGLASSQMAVYATSLAFPTTLIIFGANISTSTSAVLTATGISGTQGLTKYATQSVQ